MSRERFQDALWASKRVNIIVGGAGGIGSWFTFFALRAGFNVKVYDFDLVEEHNLGGQLFLCGDIGNYKVDAISNVAALFNDSDFNLYTSKEKITEYTSHYGVVQKDAVNIFVSAFDNMKARKDLFNLTTTVKNYFANDIIYFVDGRLLMEQMRIYCINMNEEKKISDYISNHLFDDSEVEELPCTMKQVSHGAAMIATHMIGFVTNIVSNNTVWEEDVFKVPYIWDYIIPMNKITEQYEAS